MLAVDFFNEVETPEDWLLGLMPCLRPDRSMIFQESEMEDFITYLALNSNQMTLVVGADITRRNLLFKEVRDALLGTHYLFQSQRADQITLTNGTRVEFMYALLLQTGGVHGCTFTAVLLGNPVGCPEEW